MMKNPNEHGCLIVETEGGNNHTRCYPGPSRDGRSKHFKVKAGIFKNGFNPKKITFHGERITIYAKNMTLQFDEEGNVTTLPVDTWRAPV